MGIYPHVLTRRNDLAVASRIRIVVLSFFASQNSSSPCELSCE